MPCRNIAAPAAARGPGRHSVRHVRAAAARGEGAGRVLFHAPRERIAQRVRPSIARVTALDGERCVVEASSTPCRVRPF